MYSWTLAKQITTSRPPGMDMLPLDGRSRSAWRMIGDGRPFVGTQGHQPDGGPNRHHYRQYHTKARIRSISTERCVRRSTTEIS